MVAMQGLAVKNGGQDRYGGSSGLPKLLASPDKKIRQRAIGLLVAWLSAQKQLTNVDLMKIWKGLFYCLWHTDKASVQADLIERLASLLLLLDVKVSLQFFECFLSTMRREWGGIDSLRLDKFYLLIKKFLGSMFKLLHSQYWDEEWVAKFMIAISEKAFLASDFLPAQGVILHLVEIFLGELKPCLPTTARTFDRLLEPFYSVLSHASDKILLERVKESVFMCLLKEARIVQNSTDKNSTMDSKLGVLASGLPLSDRFFELAASRTVAQGNRKILYKLYEESSKLQKPQVVSEEFVSQSEQVILQSKPLAGVVEADPGQSAPMRKKKKPKLESGSNFKKKHGLSSVTMALKEGSSHTVPPSADMAIVQDNLHLCFPAEKQLVYPEDCTFLFEDGTAKKKQAAVDQHVGEMVKENPDLEKKASASSSKRKNLTARNSGPTVIRNKTQVGQNNVHTEQSMCVSSGANPKSANAQEGESLDAVAAGVGLDRGDFTVSNLSKKFNTVVSDDTENSPNAPFRAFSQLSRSPRNTGSKKRKKSKSEVTPSQINQNGESPGSSPIPSEGKQDINGSEKKVKKVSFSLKNNVVWKPKSPLPPRTLRLPQSSIPRGSALKKGVPAGPIQATPLKKKRT